MRTGQYNKKPKTTLRIERFLCGMTLQQLAEATGRSRMFFSRLETGGSATLTPEIAEKIASVLGTVPEKLFTEGGNR